jgi:hypothetical protein
VVALDVNIPNHQSSARECSSHFPKPQVYVMVVAQHQEITSSSGMSLRPSYLVKDLRQVCRYRSFKPFYILRLYVYVYLHIFRACSKAPDNTAPRSNLTIFIAIAPQSRRLLETFSLNWIPSATPNKPAPFQILTSDGFNLGHNSLSPVVAH